MLTTAVIASEINLVNIIVCCMLASGTITRRDMFACRECGYNCPLVTRRIVFAVHVRITSTYPCGQRPEQNSHPTEVNIRKNVNKLTGNRKKKRSNRNRKEKNSKTTRHRRPLCGDLLQRYGQYTVTGVMSFACGNSCWY